MKNKIFLLIITALLFFDCGQVDGIDDLRFIEFLAHNRTDKTASIDYQSVNGSNINVEIQPGEFWRKAGGDYEKGDFVKMKVISKSTSGTIMFEISCGECSNFPGGELTKTIDLSKTNQGIISAILQ